METIDLSALVQKPSQTARVNMALLYGLPGGGKSTLAASAVEVPEYRPVLIIDTEGSTVGTLTMYSEYDDDIKIVPAKDHATLKSILDHLKAGTIGEALGDPTWVPKTVVIDTFDVAQERVLKVAEKIVMDNTGKEDGFKTYGMVKDWSNEVAETFRDSNYLGILVTHLKRTDLEEGGFVDGLSLVGRSRETLPGIPDIVALVERNDGVTTAHFESSKKNVSKNRHRLPAVMEEPTFAKIHAIAVKNKEEK